MLRVLICTICTENGVGNLSVHNSREEQVKLTETFFEVVRVCGVIVCSYAPIRSSTKLVIAVFRTLPIRSDFSNSRAYSCSASKRLMRH